MIIIADMLCWCCEHFVLYEDEERDVDYLGVCKMKDKKCSPDEKVCKEFIIKSGLHTNLKLFSIGRTEATVTNTVGIII